MSETHTQSSGRLKRLCRRAKEHPVIFVIVAGLLLWTLHVVYVYYRRGYEAGLISPGNWWYEMPADNAAAWLQAIGSVLALAVAVGIEYFAAKERKIERQEERQRRSIEAEERAAEAKRRRAYANRLTILAMGRVTGDVQVSDLVSANLLPNMSEANARSTLGLEALSNLEDLLIEVPHLEESAQIEFANLIQKAREYRAIADQLLTLKAMDGHKRQERINALGQAGNQIKTMIKLLSDRIQREIFLE